MGRPFWGLPRTQKGGSVQEIAVAAVSRQCRQCVWCGNPNIGPLQLCEECDRFALALRLRDAKARGILVKENGTEPDD